jgi:hypothetical protein
VVIDDVSAGGLPSLAGMASPYSLVALDAGGRVIGRVALKAAQYHADSTPGGPAIAHELLEASVPARSVASLEIAQGKRIRARLRVPPAGLRLKLVGKSLVCKQQMATVRLRTTVTTAFSQLLVQLPAGRGWRTIQLLGPTTILKLSAALIPRHTKRLRLVASDGFGSAVVMVRVPAACARG